MGRVGGRGGLNVTPGIPYSRILLVILNSTSPIKFYLNQAKIAKVCHLGSFWVGGLGWFGGLNMAQQLHPFVLVVSLH